MNLSKVQKEIIESESERIVVLSRAATGKTLTLTERTRYLLHKGIDPKQIAVITFTNLAAQELRQRLAEDYKDGIFIGTIHSLAYNMLVSHGINCDDLINKEKFDDFFVRLEEHQECVRHYEYILLDEAQDSSDKEFNFIFGMIDPENFFVIGDDFQCQPENTQILRPNQTTTPIQDLKIGDEILSYDLAGGRVTGGIAKNAKNSKIVDICKRKLGKNEPLIKVTLTNGYVTKYTPNHRAIANLCKYDEYNYLVYLMCDSNNRFRVGTSQFKNTNTCPWRKKMIAENCEKMWILDSFKTNKEARILEDKISYLYQIPQLTFQLDKTTYTQNDIDYIYEGLDTFANAKKCLNDFHRDINYPIAEKGDNIHYAGNAFNKVYACNLLPKNMKLKIFNPSMGSSRSEAIDIEKIEYEISNNIDVYSLKVEPYETYIGDGIITHNSIYSFRNAKPQLLINLSRRADVKTYVMNENYRNAPQILDVARLIIKKNDIYDDSIAMRDTYGIYESFVYSPENLVKRIKKYGSYKDWSILTRSNAQVAMIQQDLERYGIPTLTFKQGDVSQEELKNFLDADKVKVLTIHSSKGLSLRYVGVYGAWWGKKEEHRLNYVAATRAMDGLFWMKEPKKNMKKNWF